MFLLELQILLSWQDVLCFLLTTAFTKKYSPLSPRSITCYDADLNKGPCRLFGILQICLNTKSKSGLATDKKGTTHASYNVYISISLRMYSGFLFILFRISLFAVCDRSKQTKQRNIYCRLLQLDSILTMTRLFINS
jgi:hypothetical protein